MPERTTVITGNFSPEYLDWRRLRSELEKAGGDPYGIVTRLDGLLESRGWEALTDQQGTPFSSFSDFVSDHHRGLGMRPDELVKLIGVQGKTERRALDTGNDNLLDLFSRVREGVRVAVREDVAPVARHGTNQHADGGVRGTKSTTRDDADSILARLKRDDPMTAQAVISGDLTANAAARMKGWRKPRILLTSPQSVADRMRKHYSPEERRQIAELLTQED